jgi:isochorismate synthase
MDFCKKNDALYEVIDFTENGFVFASFDGQLNHLIPVNVSDNITLTGNYLVIRSRGNCL